MIDPLRGFFLGSIYLKDFHSDPALATYFEWKFGRCMKLNMLRVYSTVLQNLKALFVEKLDI